MKTEWKKLLNNEDFSRSESAVALSGYIEFGIAFWPAYIFIDFRRVIRSKMRN